MWKLDLRSRRTTILPFGENAFSVSSARTVPKLVYDRRGVQQSGYLARGRPHIVGEGNTKTVDRRPLRPDWDPEISMDGAKIVFTSMRSGSNNIWTCDAEGSNCTQLTDLERASSPRWSPDGRAVVFACDFEGNPDVCVVEVESLFVRRLTEETSADAPGFWSFDGGSIYFASNRSGNAQVWKIPARGGPPIQITKNGGLDSTGLPRRQLPLLPAGERRSHHISGGCRRRRRSGGPRSRIPRPQLDALARTNPRFV